jgi:hydrogenase maturation factor
MAPLKPGKLPPDLLHRLLTTYLATARKDPRLIVGAAIGEDAAVIDMGGRYLIATADPVTFATEAIGYYAVVVNANDIATRGGRPQWFLATLLLPDRQTSEALVEAIFAQIAQACEAFDIAWIGGHTEVTYGLDRPIVSGHMLGEVAPDALVTTGGARIGDVLLLTKGICIEAAALIARERQDELRRRGIDEAVIRRARSRLYDPGISVVRDAQIACGAGRVHAMHDPTEGGLAAALHELARAAGVGVVVELQQIPVLEDAAVLCEAYGLDPLGTIASGALLIAVDAADAAAVQAALRQSGIACARIGRIVPPAEGIILDTGGERRPLPHFERDEIAKLFGA